MSMKMNSNEILLRRVALRTAYAKKLITLQTFNNEMAEISKHEEKLNAIERNRQELIKQAKKKIIVHDFATV
jgi:hypothetical protein